MSDQDGGNYIGGSQEYCYCSEFAAAPHPSHGGMTEKNVLTDISKEDLKKLRESGVDIKEFPGGMSERGCCEKCRDSLGVEYCHDKDCLCHLPENPFGSLHTQKTVGNNRKEIIVKSAIAKGDLPDISTTEEGWEPSMSPRQEWRLHNGEGAVPEWFIRFSELLRAASRKEGAAARDAELLKALTQQVNEVTENGTNIPKIVIGSINAALRVGRYETLKSIIANLSASTPKE